MLPQFTNISREQQFFIHQQVMGAKHPCIHRHPLRVNTPMRILGAVLCRWSPRAAECTRVKIR